MALAGTTRITFYGGPWDGEHSDVFMVTGPVFSVGHAIGSHYWLNTKSDPPRYHWDGEKADGPAQPPQATLE